MEKGKRTQPKPKAKPSPLPLFLCSRTTQQAGPNPARGPACLLPRSAREVPGPAQRPVPSARATPTHARAQAHPPALTVRH